VVAAGMADKDQAAGRAFARLRTSRLAGCRPHDKWLKLDFNNEKESKKFINIISY
jgi:predicted aminopeptidase